MFPRRFTLVVITLCLAVGSFYGQADLAPQPVSRPQTDLVELSLGYNYIHLGQASPETASLHGFDFSTFINLTSWLGLGGDFMADFGSRSHTAFFSQTVNVDSERYLYLFGPRVTVWHNPSFRIFLEALAGGVHAKADVSDSFLPQRTQRFSDDALAMEFGGGFDWRFSKHFSWRIAQADFLPTNLGNGWQDNFRVSTAIVYSFGRK
ncbi:MAG: hypothetical protein JO201_04590 [Verrucomicrobia bacterium]|nr:hypothetical protein [Verrucomicrobiota bacterium]